VLSEGEAASKIDQIVADSVNLDGRDGLAIAGLGLAEVFLDGSHRGFAIGEDRGEVVSKIVADGGLGLGGGHCRGWLVGLGLALRRATERTMMHRAGIVDNYFNIS